MTSELLDSEARGGETLETTVTNVNYPKSFDPRRRRFSVSGESLTPTNEMQVRVVPKSDEAKSRIREILKKDVLFRHLDEKGMEVLTEAMEERRFNKDDIIVKEGDDGHELYVIDQGSASVYYGDEQVAVLKEGQAFGEIALMYNCPRTATVKANEPMLLWSLDRSTFQRVLMTDAIQRRTRYENFLANVEFLKPLKLFERSKIADALEVETYQDGEKIVVEGDVRAEKFYIVEEGTVDIYKRDANTGKDVKINCAKRGDYFGELALLTKKPRQATCIANGNVRCLVLLREHFYQILGSFEHIFPRLYPGVSPH